MFKKSQTYSAIALALAVALSPLTADAAGSVKVNAWGEGQMSAQGDYFKKAINQAKEKNIDCLSWDTVWTSAGDAMAAYAMFGRNFCGPMTTYNRSKTLEWRVGSYTNVSDNECRHKTGVGTWRNWFKWGAVEKRYLWRKGTTNRLRKDRYVNCTVHYVLAD